LDTGKKYDYIFKQTVKQEIACGREKELCVFMGNYIKDVIKKRGDDNGRLSPDKLFARAKKLEETPQVIKIEPSIDESKITTFAIASHIAVPVSDLPIIVNSANNAATNHDRNKNCRKFSITDIFKNIIESLQKFLGIRINFWKRKVTFIHQKKSE